MRRNGFVANIAMLLTAGAVAGCGGGDMMMAVESVDCEVVIVGGGPGGLHTAFRLGPTLGKGVCLVEKEAQLGGRIRDIAMDGTVGGPGVGTGARRVMETQDVLFGLATELGLKLETPPGATDLIEARGKFSFSKDDLVPLYPTLPDPDPMTDRETALYDLLRKGPERAKAATYGDFRDYVRKVVGFDGYNYLRDMTRFRADFEYPIDARGYLDYLDEEWDVCCTASYPQGGMSSFIRGMEAKATSDGVRIFKSSQVSEIRKDGTRYRVTAGARQFHAGKIVIAISPHWLDQVQGDVAERIRQQPQFKQLVGVRVVTVTQFWPDAWWAQVKNAQMMKDNLVWRAWTTDHCVNFVEIPQEPWAAALKVTRSVYDDDIRCVQLWEELLEQGQDKVEAEIQRGLSFLFNNNGVSTPMTVNIPAPLKTYAKVWPDAWHYLGAGATFTNAQIFKWAVEPLAGEPVALVGEAYNPQRSGWSDGAYKSSINLLNTRYGLNLPGVKQMLRGWPSVRHSRADGGH